MPGIEILPQGLRCKLTEAVLNDAVLAEDGYTYNRPAWEAHLSAHPNALRSPITHQPVAPTVVPNRYLKSLDAEWRLKGMPPPAPQEPFWEQWAEDFNGCLMEQPVVLPDGMTCDLSTARELIFRNPQHPGRSMLDQRMTFTGAQKLLRDLNVLELVEQAKGAEPGSLSRVFNVPTVAALLLLPPVQASAPVDVEMGGVGPQPLRGHRGAQACLSGGKLGCALAALLMVTALPIGLGTAGLLGSFDTSMPNNGGRIFGMSALVFGMVMATGVVVEAAKVGWRR